MDYPISDASARLLNGKFTDGDPVGGVPASKDSANYQNMVFDELLNVISSAGLTPDEADMTQLSQAISKLAARDLGVPFWHQGETPPVNCMEYGQQILNRVTYAELWSAINDPDRNMTIVTQAEAASRPGCWHSGDGSTTFGAPVSWGDVIRVWDSSGAIDIARVMGSHQDDQSLHVDQFYTAGGGTGTGTGTIPEDGSWSPFLKSGRSVDGTDTAIKFKMNGAETRMKNTAWMLCFRYQN